MVPHLEGLVLDSNRITENTKWPIELLQLKTLWVNKNEIENLSIFLDKLVKHAPNIVHLSMLGNMACPNFLNGGSLVQYKDYR